MNMALIFVGFRWLETSAVATVFEVYERSVPNPLLRVWTGPPAGAREGGTPPVAESAAKPLKN